MQARKPRLAIVSPALRAANNGNWRTAYRWSRFLGERFDVDVSDHWAQPGATACLIALHARRSAAAIAGFAEACPDCPLIVVLTGTDLYRDIGIDESARRSLDLATHLVVLQEAALDELEPNHRRKCRVIYQSAPTLKPGTPPQRTFDVILVGHMRAEKDPLTPMRAITRLSPDSAVRLIHIGDASGEFARAAADLQARRWPSLRRYRWLGARTHGETRRRIRNANAMVISSVMEGGANVIVEAITSGVPVLASRVSGNVGMLGSDYAGYFAAGDDQELARLLDHISGDGEFLARLKAQCAARAPLFDPAHERADVNRLVDDALAQRMALRHALDPAGDAKHMGTDRQER
jgi:putative glycosyltransferase (TIGR04348 family)